MLISYIENKIEELKNKIDVDKCLETLFIVGVLFYTFLKVFDYSQIIDMSSKQRSCLRAITLICIFPKVVIQKKNKKELLLALILETFALVSYIFCRSLRMFILPTILIGLKNTDIKRLIRYMFYITISAVIIHVIGFSFIYYKENNTFTGLLCFDKSIVKHVVLYNENNFFAERATLALAEYVYITDRDNKRYIKFFLLIAYSIFMLALSQSWASEIIMILISLYLLIEKNFYIIKNIELCKKIVILFSFVLSLVILLCGGLIESNKIIAFFNKAISGRVYYCTLAKDTIGISLLPQTFEFEKMILAIPVDNALSGIVLRWGVLFAVLYLVFVYVFAIKCKHDNITNYYIMLLSLWYITEVYPIELLSMPLLLIMFSNIYQAYKKLD